MSNTQRPSLQRKHTRTTTAKTDAALDETFEVLVDGEAYKVTFSDLTGAQEFRIRQVTGMSVYELIDKLQKSPGIDLLGVFMWVARTIRGDQVELMEVLEGISYASEVDVVGESEPDPPEA